MLTRRIIPCLDVANGKVIRGVKFSADREVGDPVELAAEYNRQGADELVFYDIAASTEKRGHIMDVLHCRRDQVFNRVTAGGGVSTSAQMRDLLRMVAEAVTGPVVASGGAGSPEHMLDVLTEGRADAALAAGIFHFGEFTVADAKRYLADRGVAVRPA